MVEVKDDCVRMIGWEQFVLPDAPRSTVEGSTFALYPDPRTLSTATGNHTDADISILHTDVDTNHTFAHDAEEDVDDADAEDEEEEEVVFVLDREAESWSPERRQV